MSNGAVAIEFIGSPGVGKSTIARAVAAQLGDAGWKCRYGESTDSWVAFAREVSGSGAPLVDRARMAVGAAGLLAGMKPHLRVHVQRVRRMLGWCRATHGLPMGSDRDFEVIDQGAFQLVLSLVMHADRSSASAMERMTRVLGRRAGYLYVVCEHPSVEDVLCRLEARQGIGSGGGYTMWRVKDGTREQAGSLLSEYASNVARVAGVLERRGAAVVRVDTSSTPMDNAAQIVARARAERERRTEGSVR